MFEFLKRIFKKEEKIDWSKARLITDTKKRPVHPVIKEIKELVEGKNEEITKIEEKKQEEKQVKTETKKVKKEAVKGEVRESLVKNAEEVSKESIKIYEGFLICDREMVDDVVKALQKIKEKDPTFPEINRMAYLVVLRGSDKDDIHKKLTWIVNNVEGAIGYFVRELK